MVNGTSLHIEQLFDNEAELREYLLAEKCYFAGCDRATKAVHDNPPKHSTVKDSMCEQFIECAQLTNLNMLAEVADICSSIDNLCRFDATHISESRRK